VGVLFIIGTVAGVLTLPFAGSLDDPDYLINVSANETQAIIGALLALSMGCLVMVPVMMFPIFKKHNEALALGYVVLRVLEVVTYIVVVISWLLILTLSQEYVKAAPPDTSYFQTFGTLLRAAGDWNDFVMTIVFCIGALMFYSLLYQSKLIPRFISVWGLIGAILHLVEGLLGMFGLISRFSTISIFLFLPIAVNEMFLAVWLIVKGFNPSAIASESAKQM
jgi:hypothetical protein